MISCRNCGVNIPDDAIYCPYCGCEIKSESVFQGYNRMNPNIRNAEGLSENDIAMAKGEGIQMGFIAFCFIVLFAVYILGSIHTLIIDPLLNPPAKPGPNALTLDKVIELSTKGDFLDWEDFDNFYCLEERYDTMDHSQYRIFQSYPDFAFEIAVEGNKYQLPTKITLYPTRAKYKKVDLRNLEEVEKFIKENKKILIK